MNKFKKVLLILIFMFSGLFIACNEAKKDDEDKIEPHECVASDWIDMEERVCGKVLLQAKKCIICDEVLEEQNIRAVHEYNEEKVDATCTEDGKIVMTCIYCGKVNETVLYANGHVNTEYRITEEALKDGIGKKELYCNDCNQVLKTTNYVNNGYFAHGKLSVNGRDLVDENGDKIQLQGLSTHGLQWFGHYINDRTIEEIVNEFGINVLRVAVYTDENGYAYGGVSVQNRFENYVREAVRITYKLGIYLIIDWHMVGAEHDEDKNPLTHLELAKSFFTKMSSEFEDYDHILYEIMNEPNGSTTWNDCKEYARQVIPCIRKYSDAVVLVGNPKWTADLNSVMNSPLSGFDNIMYTYHFYAADHRDTTQVAKAYDKGFPVFISEYGFMDSSGDGNINSSSGENWMSVLNSRNISYVAWNISNSPGSASIFKYNSQDMYDVSDENLKEWGIYLKNMYRNNVGLS